MGEGNEDEARKRIAEGIAAMGGFRWRDLEDVRRKSEGRAVTELERVLCDTGADAIEARIVCWVVRWLPLISREWAINHADGARGLDSGRGIYPDPDVAAAAGALWDRRVRARLGRVVRWRRRTGQ